MRRRLLNKVLFLAQAPVLLFVVESLDGFQWPWVDNLRPVHGVIGQNLIAIVEFAITLWLLQVRVGLMVEHLHIQEVLFPVGPGRH